MIVWDAATTSNGILLNDNLLGGLDLLSNLNVTFFQFRERKNAVRGDVEKMFHQAAMKRQDQVAHRCL